MEIKPLGLSDQLRMIKGVDSLIPKKSPTEGVPADAANKPSFGDFLKQQFTDLNQQGLEADHAIQHALLGDEVNPHQTMIALQKADISFKLMLNVSQKLIQSYQELVKTPIG